MIIIIVRGNYYPRTLGTSCCRCCCTCLGALALLGLMIAMGHKSFVLYYQLFLSYYLFFFDRFANIFGVFGSVLGRWLIYHIDRRCNA
ncbi:hypothetical protein F4781DRAFT_383674 [Annulohypoxylon bovei var. microspora]|nr:hypothetical protein F4781DRAFT_383674 [Annulohypoxylon bovei var. microspora]